MNEAVFLALEALMRRYLNLYRVNECSSYPCANFDPPWPSPCMEFDGSQELPSGAWRPVERRDIGIFDSMQDAFGFEFHPDIKTYYGAYWSNGFCAQWKDLDLALIQIWNDEDEEAFKQNMLGHLFARKKNGLPPSYFLGTTDGSEIITLDQETGAVQLERPGYAAHETLSDSLELFLIGLIPNTNDYDG